LKNGGKVVTAQPTKKRANNCGAAALVASIFGFLFEEQKSLNLPAEISTLC